MPSGDLMIKAWNEHYAYELKRGIPNRDKPQILEIGHYYYCTLCSRFYKRKKSKKSYAACGHWLSAQREINECEYKLLRRNQ